MGSIPLGSANYFNGLCDDNVFWPSNRYRVATRHQIKPLQLRLPLIAKMLQRLAIATPDERPDGGGAEGGDSRRLWPTVSRNFHQFQLAPEQFFSDRSMLSAYADRRTALPSRLWRFYFSATVAGSTAHMGN